MPGLRRAAPPRDHALASALQKALAARREQEDAMRKDLWGESARFTASTSKQFPRNEPTNISEDDDDISPAASYHSSQEEVPNPQTAKPLFSSFIPTPSSGTPTDDPTTSLTLKLHRLSLAPVPNPSSPTSHRHFSPTASLESIDLRSPSDDPDYDFIEVSEAVHSARNAQPDRKGKYPELEAESKAFSIAQRELAERAESENPDYDFIEKSEAIHSARNAHRDRRGLHPEVEGEKVGKEVERGGGSGKGKKKKKKDWFF